MNERITLISLLNEEQLDMMNAIVNNINEELCKVPFGKNVDNRYTVDTLPYHFTIFSWSIKKEEEVVNFLKSIPFVPFKVLIDKIDIMKGNEDSYVLYLNVSKNKELYELQNHIFKSFSSKYYNPDVFNFHITIHIDKDYTKIITMREKLLKNFTPFELQITMLGLFEIYPAKLVYKIFN